MPTSCWKHLSFLAEVLRHLRPASILDVGTGFGKYGFVAREYLDIYENRHPPSSWQIKIDGIEAWESYISPVHRYLYSSLFIGDALHVIDNLASYEMVTAGDVIEHLPKDRATLLLHKVIDHATKWVLVSIPLGGDWAQPASDGNPYQAHQSVWTSTELSVLGFKIYKFRDEFFRPYCVALLSRNGAASFKKVESYRRASYEAVRRRLSAVRPLRAFVRWARSRLGANDGSQ